MGIAEGLALWMGTSILFALSIGKFLHSVDRRERGEEHAQSESTVDVVVFHASALTER